MSLSDELLYAKDHAIVILTAGKDLRTTFVPGQYFLQQISFKSCQEILRRLRMTGYSTPAPQIQPDF
jgi:hypothetical protein